MYKDAVSHSKSYPNCAVAVGGRPGRQATIIAHSSNTKFSDCGVDVLKTERACSDFLSKWPIVFPRKQSELITLMLMLTDTNENLIEPSNFTNTGEVIAADTPYFLEILPQRDFISRRCTMWQQFRFRGQCLQRWTCMRIHSISNKPILCICMQVMRVRIFYYM